MLTIVADTPRRYEPLTASPKFDQIAVGILDERDHVGAAVFQRAGRARGLHAFLREPLAESVQVGHGDGDMAVRGKKLATVRRLLDLRLRKKKGPKDKGLSQRSHTKCLTPNDLLRVYQRETDKQRLLARKADFTQARLFFIVEAMKDLQSDEGFITLLRAEGLVTMPQALAARIGREARKID